MSYQSLNLSGTGTQQRLQPHQHRIQFPTLHLVSASKLETNYIPPTVGSFPDFMAISKSGIICRSVPVVGATQIVYQ